MQTKAVVTNSSNIYDGDLNIAWLYSGLNRKMMEPVDSKGNAQNFLLKIKARSGADQQIVIKTATPTYVTKQAVKSWFRVWRDQFKSAGISMKDLGPYGRVFKPKLRDVGTSGAMSSGDYFGGTETRLGTWTYSEIISNAAYSGNTNDALEANDLVDVYGVHLTGASTTESGGGETLKFQNVGMINSWLDSRKKTVVDAAVSEDDLVGSDNPLILARGSQAISTLVIDETRQMQAEKAPYVDTQLDELTTQAVLRAGPNVNDEAVIQAPCGWINLDGNDGYALEIELLGIADL